MNVSLGSWHQNPHLLPDGPLRRETNNAKCCWIPVTLWRDKPHQSHPASQYWKTVSSQMQYHQLYRKEMAWTHQQHWGVMSLHSTCWQRPFAFCWCQCSYQADRCGDESICDMKSQCGTMKKTHMT